MTSLDDAEHPAWSFDGQRLALSSRSDRHIHTIREDGTDLRHVLDWNDGDRTSVLVAGREAAWPRR